LERSGEKLAESAEKIKRSTHGVEDSAARTLSSRPTAPCLPLSAPTLLGCAPASWLWRAVSERRRYFRKFVLSSPAFLPRKSMCHASRHGFWSPWMDFSHSWPLLRL